MSIYSAEERARILQEARDNLERTESIAQDAALNVPLGEDPGLLWRQRAEEREQERERERKRIPKETEIRAMEQRIEAQLRAMLTESFQAIVTVQLAAQEKYLIEHLLPELVAYLKQSIADDVSAEIERAYKLALADVRADMSALRDAVRKVSGLMTGTDPIDVPTIPLRHPKPN